MRNITRAKMPNLGAAVWRTTLNIKLFMLSEVCAWITVITFTKIYWILPMHSNVTIKNVSWPHFSWATLYIFIGKPGGSNRSRVCNTSRVYISLIRTHYSIITIIWSDLCKLLNLILQRLWTDAFVKNIQVNYISALYWLFLIDDWVASYN